LESFGEKSRREGTGLRGTTVVISYRLEGLNKLIASVVIILTKALASRQVPLSSLSTKHKRAERSEVSKQVKTFLMLYIVSNRTANSIEQN
jgi:hypothetical protein